jgi:hypothetical protein
MGVASGQSAEWPGAAYCRAYYCAVCWVGHAYINGVEPEWTKTCYWSWKTRILPVYAITTTCMAAFAISEILGHLRLPPGTAPPERLREIYVKHDIRDL